MSDGLLQALMERLGVRLPQPTGPEATPEQRKAYEEMAQKNAGPAAKAFGAAVDVGRGLFADPNMPIDQLQATSPWQKLGMLGAAAPIFPQKGIKGLYSRVEKVAESIPETISAGKLASILKSRTAKEELDWRKIPQAIGDTSGNKAVRKGEFVEHLKKNPLDVKVTERVADPHSYGKKVDDNWYNEHQPTTYDNYQMPEAKNYRETLIQLQKDTPGALNFGDWYEQIKRPNLPDTAPNSFMELDSASQDALWKQYEVYKTQVANPNFIGHHWEEPNVLVHVRHNERRLPGELPEGFRVETGTNHRFDPATWVTGPIEKTEYGSKWYDGPDVSIPTGDIRDITDKHKQEAVRLAMLDRLGPKGRMLENIQSDWHQRGAHSGYGEPEINPQTLNEVSVENFTQAQIGLEREIDEIAKFIQGQGYFSDESFRAATSNEDRAHLLFDDLSRIITDAEIPESASEASLAVADQARGLKERLHNVRATYDQAHDAMVRAKSDRVPDAPFKDSWAELALKQQLLDVADRPDLDWIGIAPQSELSARGEDISPAFQDVQLPKTLEKLLKPFGGTVEKADLGIKPTRMSDPVSVITPRRSNDPLAVADELGPHGGLYQPNIDLGDKPLLSFLPNINEGPKTDHINALKNQIINQRPNIQAFIARLSPEMKQAIKEKGFPLLMLLLAQQAQGADSGRTNP